MPHKYVICPKCQTQIPITHKIGRKPLNIGVKNICDALRDSYTVTQAAKKLDCSRAYLYKTLKEQGKSPKTFTKGGGTEK